MLLLLLLLLLLQLLLSDCTSVLNAHPATTQSTLPLIVTGRLASASAAGWRTMLWRNQSSVSKSWPRWKSLWHNWTAPLRQTTSARPNSGISSAISAPSLTKSRRRMAPCFCSNKSSDISNGKTKRTLLLLAAYNIDPHTRTSIHLFSTVLYVCICIYSLSLSLSVYFLLISPPPPTQLNWSTPFSNASIPISSFDS